MSRKGREFEKLVETFERVLAPHNVTVKSPDSIEDLDTGSPREIDISIRGKIGSVDVLIICECRDRKKPQDAPWIEQVAGKRRSVGADIAIAISASGFYKPAITKAKEFGVLTRQVPSLRPKRLQLGSRQRI